MFLLTTKLMFDILTQAVSVISSGCEIHDAYLNSSFMRYNKCVPIPTSSTITSKKFTRKACVSSSVLKRRDAVRIAQRTDSFPTWNLTDHARFAADSCYGVNKSYTPHHHALPSLRSATIKHAASSSIAITAALLS